MYLVKEAKVEDDGMKRKLDAGLDLVLVKCVITRWRQMGSLVGRR